MAVPALGEDARTAHAAAPAGYGNRVDPPGATAECLPETGLILDVGAVVARDQALEHPCVFFGRADCEDLRTGDADLGSPLEAPGLLPEPRQLGVLAEPRND